VGPIHAQESERLCLLLGPASKTDLADARLLLLFFTDLAFANPMQIRQMYEEILKLFQEAGDQWKMAYTIFCMGLDLRHSGDLMGARQACEQSLRLFRECGDNIGASEPNRVLAFIAFEKGEYEESRTRYEEILHFYRQARLNLWMDIPLWMLGVIAVREGNYAHAKDWYSECLLFDQQMGLNSQLAECLIGFAGIANAERRLERAAQLVGAAEREVEVKPWQMPLENIDQIELQRLTTVLRGKIGDAMFEALAAEGRAMTTEQAVAYALEK
jgi:tetratricopeptide (TPR) repeat protein